VDDFITIDHLGKDYETLAVLQDWNLTIQRGERLVILGPSGSGKTTFLRILAGLELPTRGWLRLGGGREAKFGFVFQEPRLIPWLSVERNLTFVNEQAPVRDILAELGLAGFENYLPAQLSGGMRQRVNLARALAVQPDVLILDEAFNSLDLGMKMHVMAAVRRLSESMGFTLIAVTHDPKEALSLADRIVLLSARPSCVAHDLPVHLAEPRSLSAPDFLHMEAQLIDRLCRVEEQAPAGKP
jgi:NitT/TauT family transport system ATP-binding protein